MRRFLSLALAAAMLSGPASALAEFTTPAELLSAMQSEARPQSFSVTAKGHADETWFAVWANGSVEGSQTDLMHAKMKLKMTVDVVQGDVKVRTKAQVMMKEGSVYAKLDSIDGAYNDEFMSFSALFGQKLWLKLPVEEAMMEIEPAMMMGMDPASNEQSNEMFTLENTKFKGGYKYTLKLHPEFVAEFSSMMRDAFGTQGATSDDFFPFRDLAYDNADFVVTVDTNAQDQFQASKFDFHWKAGDTELTMNGSSQRQSYGVAIETPKTVWTLDELGKHFDKITGMPSYDDEDYMMPIDDNDSMMDGMTDGTFDSIDTDTSDEWWQPVDEPAVNPECWDDTISAVKMLSMQRSGECPVEDVNNRTFRN